jgi:glyoxylase-like metal-dependent hydrolase (beta-lactamase superfamily II)
MKGYRTSSFFSFLLIASILSNGQEIAINSWESDKIDSLIHTELLLPNVLLIGLGADAVTAVSTNEGIVLIDAGYSTGLAIRYRNIIENYFKGGNILYLINTHPHQDHIGGNPAFTDAITIGHELFPKTIYEATRDQEIALVRLKKIVGEYETEMQSKIFGSADWNNSFCQKMRYLNAYNDWFNHVEPIQWDSTFRDSLHLKVGNIHVELFHIGAIHSASDIAILIPELEILFTGDLFSKWGKPSLRAEEIDNINYSIEMMDVLLNKKNQINTIVGGHGQIMEFDDLEAFYRKLKSL